MPFVPTQEEMERQQKVAEGRALPLSVREKARRSADRMAAKGPPSRVVSAALDRVRTLARDVETLNRAGYSVHVGLAPTDDPDMPLLMEIVVRRDDEENA